MSHGSGPCSEEQERRTTGPELFVCNVRGYVWRVNVCTYVCVCTWVCGHKWVHVCKCGEGICICECVRKWIHMCEWVLSWKFGPAKNWSRGQKFQEKWSAQIIFPWKNLVWTWNNGPSTILQCLITIFVCEGYGSAPEVVGSIREPRYVTRQEKQSPEVAGFPWNKLVVCFNWSTHASA